MCDKKISSFLLGLFLFIPTFSFALPWDIDMNRQQSYESNEIVRAPAKGTIPLGYTPYTLTVEEASETLKNPVQFDEFSVQRGKRVWQVNCHTCHGIKGEGDGPVGSFLTVPSLLTDFYTNKVTDGKVFHVIKKGGSAMPRYGYKLTDKEHWDVVNYLRHLQGKKLKK